MLNDKNSQAFPSGLRGADVKEMCWYMLRSETDTVSKTLSCAQCETEVQSESIDTDLWNISKMTWKSKSTRLGSRNNQPVTAWMKAIVRSKSTQKCQNCHTHLNKIYQFYPAPVFIPLHLQDDIPVKLEHKAYLYENEYKLIGIIYHGGFHFTSRIVDDDGRI